MMKHRTNKKYTQIMASLKKKIEKKCYLTDLEIETDFSRFIIIESLNEMKLDYHIF